MSITAAELRAEEMRRRYAILLDDPSVFPTVTNWNYIIDNRMEGIGDALYSRYLAALAIDDVDRAELHNVAIEEFPRYLRAVSRPYAVDVVYDNISNEYATAALIRDCSLFDADSIQMLITRGQLSLAMSILDAYQPEYTDADLVAMQKLLACIEKLPVIGYHETRKGIFGTSDKYICPAGHVNDGSAVYCSHAGCGLDEQGLTADQVAKVDVLRHRIEALAGLLS